MRSEGGGGEERNVPTVNQIADNSTTTMFVVSRNTARNKETGTEHVGGVQDGAEAAEHTATRGET